MTKTKDTAQPLNTGDWVLDRYIIESKIALGGHSVVYRGIDERLSRPVCVKAFHKIASEQGIWKTAYEHFVQEAFALSKLSHPNTLRIYDFGQIEHTEGGKFPVQVSEFMAGGTLAHLVGRGGVMPLPDAVDAICKLAEALSEAHRLSIVHRDIKPQNILFTVPGDKREPKLADFGIAKSVTSDNMENQAETTAVVVGFPLAMFSPSWGAPEQLCGSDATPSIDIYSLGLVTVFALSGRAVCKSASAQEGYDKRREAPQLIGKLLDELNVPTPVIRFLQRSCAFEAEDRPESAADFASELREAFHAKEGKRLKSPAAMYVDANKEIAQPAQANLKAQGTDSTPDVAIPVSAPPPRDAKPGLPHTTLPKPHGDPVVLSRAPIMQRVGSRTCQFVEFDGEAVILQFGATRLKVMSTPAPSTALGRTLTLRGMTSFVARVDGRPSSAVHISEDCFVHMVDPRKTNLGQIFVSFGERESGLMKFRVGEVTIGLRDHECPMPLLIDSPTHKQSFLLYIPKVQSHSHQRSKRFSP